MSRWFGLGLFVLLAPLTGCLHHNVHAYAGQWVLTRNQQPLAHLTLDAHGRSLRGTLEMPRDLKETADGSPEGALDVLCADLTRRTVDGSKWKGRTLFVHIAGDEHLTPVWLDPQGSLRLAFYPQQSVPPLKFTRPQSTMPGIPPAS
jgi:hypothetical protein